MTVKLMSVLRAWLKFLRSAGPWNDEGNWGRNPFQPMSAHQQTPLHAQPADDHAGLRVQPAFLNPSPPITSSAAPAAASLPDRHLLPQTLPHPRHASQLSNAAACAGYLGAQQEEACQGPQSNSDPGPTVMVRRSAGGISLGSASSDRLSGGWTDAANGLTSASGSPSTSEWEAVPSAIELLDDGAVSEGSAYDRFAEAEAIGLPPYLVNRSLSPVWAEMLLDAELQGTAVMSLPGPEHNHELPRECTKALGVQMTRTEPALDDSTQLHVAAPSTPSLETYLPSQLTGFQGSGCCPSQSTASISSRVNADGTLQAACHPSWGGDPDAIVSSDSDAALAITSDEDASYHVYHTACGSFSPGFSCGVSRASASSQVASQAADRDLVRCPPEPQAPAHSGANVICSQPGSLSSEELPSESGMLSCTAPSAPALGTACANRDFVPESEPTQAHVPSAPPLGTLHATWVHAHDPVHADAGFSQLLPAQSGDPWTYSHGPDVTDVPLPSAFSIDTASSAWCPEGDPGHFRIRVPSVYSEGPAVHSEGLPESQRIFQELQELLGRTHDLPWASYVYLGSEPRPNLARVYYWDDPAGINADADAAPPDLLQSPIAASFLGVPTIPNDDHAEVQRSASAVHQEGSEANGEAEQEIVAGVQGHKQAWLSASAEAAPAPTQDLSADDIHHHPAAPTLPAGPAPHLELHAPFAYWPPSDTSPPQAPAVQQTQEGLPSQGPLEGAMSVQSAAADTAQVYRDNEWGVPAPCAEAPPAGQEQAASEGGWSSEWAAGWGAKWGQHWPGTDTSPLQRQACSTIEWGPFEGHQASQEPLDHSPTVPASMRMKTRHEPSPEASRSSQAAEVGPMEAATGFGRLGAHQPNQMQAPVAEGHPRDPWSLAGGPSPPITFGQGTAQPASPRQSAQMPTNFNNSSDPMPACFAMPHVPGKSAHFCGPWSPSQGQIIRTSVGLSSLADGAGQACFQDEVSEGCMHQLQLAMDLAYDSLRTLHLKYDSFPMWYLASCTDYFTANRARKALSEFEKLLDVASIPEQYLIMELRTVPYGAAISYVVNTSLGFEWMERIHSWVRDCRTCCLQALQAMSVHICNQDPARPWRVGFDFDSPQMLPAGMQWSEAIYGAMWEQAAACPRSESSLPSCSESASQTHASPLQHAADEWALGSTNQAMLLATNEDSSHAPEPPAKHPSKHASLEDGEEDVRVCAQNLADQLLRESSNQKPLGVCLPMPPAPQRPEEVPEPGQGCLGGSAHGCWAQEYGVHAAVHGFQDAASHASFDGWSPSHSPEPWTQQYASHAAAHGFQDAASHASIDGWSPYHGPETWTQQYASRAAAHGLQDAASNKDSGCWSPAHSSSHCSLNSFHDACQHQGSQPADQPCPGHTNRPALTPDNYKLINRCRAFENGSIVRQAAWKQGICYMQQVPDVHVQSVRRQPTAGYIFTAGGQAFPMVQVLISAPNFAHSEDGDYLTPPHLRMYPCIDAGKTSFAPLHQGLFLLDLCSAKTWITQDVAAKLGLTNAPLFPHDTSEISLEVELDGQLIAVNVCPEHVCMLGQDFLALRRQQVVVDYASGLIALLDVE